MATYADRVQEITLTTGIGPLTLGGASLGYRTFASAFANGTEVHYVVDSGATWEVGRGTYNAGVLTRVEVFSSSNSNALVNFAAGQKEVWCDLPASVIIDKNSPVPVSLLTGLVATARGGTGQDLSASTGTVQVEAGVVSTAPFRYRSPPGLATLPIALDADTTVGAPRNAREAFERLAGYNATPVYVSSTGITGNSGASPSVPTTMVSAIQTKTLGSRIVCLDDMVVDGIDLRNSHASQAGGLLPKLIDANGHNLVIRTTGIDLTAQVYVQDGTLTNCWTTSLSALSGSAILKRVLRTDALDDYGYPLPFLKFTSASALNASANVNGFFYDTSGKVLWVRLLSGDSVETYKAFLKGLFTDSANGASRNLVIGASLCIVGARLEGVQNVELDGGGRLARIYMHDCEQLWASSKGADLTQCGEYVVSDSLVYASESDNANAFSSSAVAKGFIQAVRCRFVRAGDTRTFTLDNTLQGASAHGGCNHVAFWCEYIENAGQGVADTTIDGSTDVTWLVDCYVEGGVSTAANLNCGSASTGSRTMWLDNVRSQRAPGAGDLVIVSPSSVRVNATTLAVVTGGSTTAYTPGVF